MENIDCGKRKLSSGRIWGGEEVERSSVPWQVAIFKHNIDDWDPKCGGTLISPYHVLTAAHCVKYQNDCWDYSVGIGMHLGNVSDGTRILVHHISNHPAYNPNRCPNNNYGDIIPDVDFSILHLNTPFTFNNKVQPACLPDDSMKTMRLGGKKLTISGWGEENIDRLYKATIPAVTNPECMRYNNRPDYFTGDKPCNYITLNMFCAGNPRNRTTSTGSGDSGGSIRFYL